jgi:hypothetical protein
VLPILFSYIGPKFLTNGSKGNRNMIEQGTNAPIVPGIGPEMPKPCPAPEITPQAASFAAPATVGAKPAPHVAAILRDIRLRQRVISAHERQERKALRDTLKRGAAVIEERGDSHGKVHEKLVPNPSIRIAREARRAINQLKKDIDRLEAELAEAQATLKELSNLERLAARAGELRK